jgi:hypothetical protein
VDVKGALGPNMSIWELPRPALSISERHSLLCHERILERFSRVTNPSQSSAIYGADL